MFRVLWKLRWFFKEQWKRYVIAVLLLLIVGILEVIPPKLVGMAIDDIHVGSLNMGWRNKILTLFIAYYGCLLWYYVCLDVSIIWRSIPR